MLQLTDATFETAVLQSSQPVVVDFYADWCAPCKALAPRLDALEAETAGVVFAKANIDDTDLAQKYGVRGIPTLIVFKDGKPVSQASGNSVASKERVAEFIQKAIA